MAAKFDDRRQEVQWARGERLVMEALPRHIHRVSGQMGTCGHGFVPAFLQLHLGCGVQSSVPVNLHASMQEHPSANSSSSGLRRHADREQGGFICQINSWKDVLAQRPLTSKANETTGNTRFCK